MSVPPFELFHGCSDGLVCRPRFRGHGTGDGFDQRVLPMEHVRCVVGLQRVFHRGQQPGRFIARRLDHPAIALGQGRRQEGIPRSVIAGLSQLCHKNTVALRVHRDEAKAAGKRFVLGHRKGFWGHAVGSAYGVIVVGGHHRLFHVEIGLLLSPIGGRNKAVKACQSEEETDQANAACPDCNADEMEGNHDAV